MNREEMAREATRLVAEQILGSARYDEHEAARSGGDPGREAAAVIKRRVALLLLEGVTAAQVTGDGDVGMVVGPLTLAPPPDATYEQLQAHQDLLRQVRDTAHDRILATNRPMRETRSTLDTVQLDPEELQPDPLTATPEAATGAQRAFVRAEDAAAQEYYLQYLGHRVAVAWGDGQHSRGVLASVTPEGLRLDPCESGTATIRLELAGRVKLLGPRADTAVWTRGPGGRLARQFERAVEEPPAGYPAEPVTGPLPDREAVESGPHRIPGAGPGADLVPATMTVTQLTALDPPLADAGQARVEVPTFAEASPGLLRRLREGLVRLTIHQESP